MAYNIVAIYPSTATDPDGEESNHGEDYSASYTSMGAMEAGEVGDLTDNGGTTLIAEITKSDGNWSSADLASVNFVGWTTSAEYDVTITALDDGASRNPYDGTTNGTYSTSYYRREEDNGQCININNIPRIDLTVDGVQMKMLEASDAVGDRTFNLAACGTNSVFNFNGCYFRHSGTSGSNISANDSDADIWLTNCVVECVSGINQNFSVICNDLNVYNCTIMAPGETGIITNATGTETIINCAVFNCSDDFNGTFSSINYCAHDDATETNETNRVDISPGTETTDWAACFEDYSNKDFRLKDQASVLWQAGWDQTSDSNIPSTDIMGNIRPSGSNPVSIGAFENLGLSSSSGSSSSSSFSSSSSSVSSSSSESSSSSSESSVSSSSSESSSSSSESSVSSSSSESSSSSASREHIIYVDPDASGLDDGTSWTDAYTSLSSAIAAEEGDLTNPGFNPNNYFYTFLCRMSGSSVDDVNVTISGWTTDADNYVRIMAAPGHEAGVTWDTNKYIVNGLTVNTIRIREGFFRIQNLQIAGSWTRGFYIDPQSGGAGGIYVTGCHVQTGGTTGIYGFTTLVSNSTCYIYNNIIEGSDSSTSSGIWIQDTNANLTFYAENNTVDNCDYGLRRSLGTLYAYNNLVTNIITSPNDNTYMGTFAGSSNNVTDSTDETANGITEATPGYIGGSPYSWAIGSGSGAVDAGTDSVNGGYTTDIVGTSRPWGSDWDAGAFEYVGSSSSVSSSSSSSSVSSSSSGSASSSSVSSSSSSQSSSSSSISSSSSVSSSSRSSSSSSKSSSSSSESSSSSTSSSTGVYEISGITYDKNGSILGSCDVFLCRDNGDDTLTFLEHAVSNAVTGAYSFSGPDYGTANHIVISWKDDSPHIFDCTDHVLQGTLV